MPAEVEFATKPQLAVDLLTQLHTAGRLAPWVAADAVYGRDSRLRSFLEQHAVGYVSCCSRASISYLARTAS